MSGQPALARRLGTVDATVVGGLSAWGFVVGKTASCAAMAMTFAAYALPDATSGSGPG